MLKACPFCGSTEQIIKELISWKKPNPYEVYCRGCGCYTRICKAKEEAIEVWNRRATDEKV